MHTNYNRQDFPLLMKRKHLLSLGLSDDLYYKLIREKKLPTIKLNNRTYINRDAFFDMLEQKTTIIETEQ